MAFIMNDFLRNKAHRFKKIALIVLCILLFAGCENLFVENLDTSDKSIALTFDDGPDPIYTMAILDILKEKDIKATFFLVGNKMKKYPQVTERIFEEGHCLANHTYTHIDLRKKSFKEILAEIQQTEQILVNVCGDSKKLFRPPWGHITNSEKESLKKLGYKIVLWDVDSKDYKSGISVSNIIDNAMTGIGKNKIILFHDSDYQEKESRENTVLALPVIIDFYKTLGYHFVTIDKLESN